MKKVKSDWESRLQLTQLMSSTVHHLKISTHFMQLLSGGGLAHHNVDLPSDLQALAVTMTPQIQTQVTLTQRCEVY